MIEAELILEPTESVNESTYQLCILTINSTFPQGSTYQSSEAPPIVHFDESTKEIKVDIDILDGDQSNIQNIANLDNFPFRNEIWNVEITYHHNDSSKPKKKAKPIQMEINIEPKPIDQFAIR